MNHASVGELIPDSIRREVTSGVLSPGVGVSVAVVRGEEVLFRGSYGLRDRARSLPVTHRTIFDVASLTKAVTATTVMMAAERGLIDIDRPINSPSAILPLQETEVSRQLSISDILSHQTGVSPLDILWYFGGLRGKKLRRVVEQVPTIPGAFRQSFIYSNIMYAALGEIFEDLVGEPWESFAGQRLFAPLTMSSTAFRPREREDDVALPYLGTQEMPRADLSAVAAAGAMRSTLEDLTRWMAFWVAGGRTARGEQLVAASSIERMLQPRNPFASSNPDLLLGLDWLGKDLHYGLGWFISSARRNRIAFHPGLIDGFTHVLAIVPEQRLGVVVMTNANPCTAPGSILRDLLSHYGVVTDVDLPSPADSSAVGDYDNPLWGTLSIARSGSGWSVNYNGHEWPLVWKTETTAEVTLVAAGQRIPLPVTVTTKEGKIEDVVTPLGLDPRVQPFRFSRTSA